MTLFSKMWIDIEDPHASPDTVANAAFIQAGVAQCARRIFSGIYGNEGSLQRIIGDYMGFAGYPYDRASGDGVPDVNNVPVNGMTVTYEQFSLDRQWNGHGRADRSCLAGRGYRRSAAHAGDPVASGWP